MTDFYADFYIKKYPPCGEYLKLVAETGFEPAKALLRFLKSFVRLGAAHDFDRCVSSARTALIVFS